MSGSWFPDLSDTWDTLGTSDTWGPWGTWGTWGTGTRIPDHHTRSFHYQMGTNASGGIHPDAPLRCQRRREQRSPVPLQRPSRQRVLASVPLFPGPPYDVTQAIPVAADTTQFKRVGIVHCHGLQESAIAVIFLLVFLPPANGSSREGVGRSSRGYSTVPTFIAQTRRACKEPPPRMLSTSPPRMRGKGCTRSAARSTWHPPVTHDASVSRAGEYSPAAQPSPGRT